MTNSDAAALVICFLITLWGFLTVWKLETVVEELHKIIAELKKANGER